MKNLTEFFAKLPWLAVLAISAIIAYGTYKYIHLPVDAFPDISPVMVPVFAEDEGLAPEEIERLVTYPIESVMNGLPNVREVKSTSAFGMAAVYVYFDDDTDLYFARQLVNERMSSVKLPQGCDVTLGPITTGLGQIFLYYLKADKSKVDTGGKEINTWLRELNDWDIQFKLQSVRGVTDVLSMGGDVLQYQIVVNPVALRRYGLTMGKIEEAVKANNRNEGGQYIVVSDEEYLVRGIGLIKGVDDIANIPLRVEDTKVVRIRDVAKVELGKEIRRGAVTRNGDDEVVSGIVLKLYGQNTAEVIEKLKEKVEQIRKTLPKGVEIVPYYDQSKLVKNATDTVKNAIWQGAILIIAVLLLFLGDIRTSFVVALSLPVSACCAVILMDAADVSANLMSLGGIAIAIGMLGDGTIVAVENILRNRSNPDFKNLGNVDSAIRSTLQVARPILFSIFIIILVFVPVFSLENVEGKMFRPIAFTITCALIGSLFMAICIAPAITAMVSQKNNAAQNFIVREISKIYSVSLNFVLSRKFSVLSLCSVLFVGSIFALYKTGREFIPNLEENAVLISVSMTPSISLDKAVETVRNLEKKLREFPEVGETVSRIGRPEAGSHPHPVNTAEIQFDLPDSSEWKSAKTKTELVAKMRAKLSEVSGVQFNFSQPIQNAFAELLSGVKTQVAIKIFGSNISELRRLASEVQKLISPIKGITDLSVESSFGQPQLNIEIDRAKAARFDINADKILSIVRNAIGGAQIDDIYVDTKRFGISARYDKNFRDTAENIARLNIETDDGKIVPLSDVASVKEEIGAIQINREHNQRRWVVQCNLDGVDVARAVSQIRDVLDRNLKLPAGYYIEYGGQFENQQRAMDRFAIIIPLVVLGVFVLLYAALKSLKDSMVIIANIPLSLVGGAFGLWICGEYLSVPAAIGFIALFGIAVQNSMVMVSRYTELVNEGNSLSASVKTGSSERVRPVLMTALTTILGLLPLLLSSQAGAEVQRPLATVVVFGLIFSTFTTLFIVPIFYSLIHKSETMSEN